MGFYSTHRLMAVLVSCSHITALPTIRSHLSARFPTPLASYLSATLNRWPLSSEVIPPGPFLSMRSRLRPTPGRILAGSRCLHSSSSLAPSA